MAKVVLICGKICCGKTTYAQKLCAENKAVLLSVDEILLTLFGRHCGDKHDEYTEKAKAYLLNKSLELVKCGMNTVLDWGFWKKSERKAVKEFFNVRDMVCELHYVDVSDDVWKSRIDCRNKAVLAAETSAYYIDDNLSIKFDSMFEAPDKDEIDVFHQGEEK